MSGGNSVTLVGNATRDPELRFTPAGQAVANFGLAVNRRWFNKQTEEWDEAVSFFDVAAWSDLADNIAESVTKGMRLIVVGRLDQSTWEDQDGNNRSKVQIVADEIGPSLRWATAEVARTERQEADKPKKQGSNRKAGGSRKSEPAYDEEPF